MIVQVQMHKNLILMFVFLFFSVAQAQVPSEPTNLMVTPINTGGMILFTAPSSIGGSAITNYEYSINNGEWVTPNPAIAISPLIISSGLINCTSHQVKLRAVNTSGSGPASDSVALIPAVSNSVGVNWATRNNVGSSINSIIFGNGLFVAVSSIGQVITSPDGVNWTSRTSAANNNWMSVTY